MLTIIYAIESLKSTFLPVKAATLQRSASAPTILTERISREEQARLNEQLRQAIIGNAPRVDALIRAGADVNAATQHGSTPLILAVGVGNENIVKALIKAGADVNAVNEYGNTPLILAKDEKIVNALIAVGADVNAVNWEGKTPMTYALSSGNQNIIAAIQNAIAERQAGRAYKEAIVRASTFAESARKLSGQSIPYGMNARILEALRPEVITVQFLIGGDFITAEELSRWNVQWDGRRGMTDEERQYIYDRVDPTRVMKHIEANTPS